MKSALFINRYGWSQAEKLPNYELEFESSFDKLKFFAISKMTIYFMCGREHKSIRIKIT